MEPFNTLTAIALPLDRMNVDTDAIIPKQFLKKIERTGFGVHLFHEDRFLDDAGTQINPAFVLNFPRYRGAQILVSRDNFGCGSSREHAPWSLLDYGFRCIIASSFADIFYNNCFKNGILPVVLSAKEVQTLFEEIEATEGYQLSIDLPNQVVQTSKGTTFQFDVEPFSKDCLIKGLDDIGWTLGFASHIQRFESNYKQQSPWMIVQ
ncbi:3-isopropylmalate dehydratase small subunit [Deltaproteobacteria bacterium TL4]